MSFLRTLLMFVFVFSRVGVSGSYAGRINNCSTCLIKKMSNDKVCTMATIENHKKILICILKILIELEREANSSVSISIAPHINFFESMCCAKALQFIFWALIVFTYAPKKTFCFVDMQ